MRCYRLEFEKNPASGSGSMRTAPETPCALCTSTVSATGPLNVARPPQGHPVVRTHPDTGRKALYVNADYTKYFDGMTEQESAPLLKFLYEHACRPEFTCRHRWRDGDILMWDNRATSHYAAADYDGPRVLHRLTVAGDRPFGPLPAT